MASSMLSVVLFSLLVAVVHGGNVCNPPTLGQNQRNLHDSTSFEELIGPSQDTQWMVQDFDNDGVTWSEDPSSVACSRTVAACGNASTSPDQNNVLVLDYLNKPSSADGPLPLVSVRIDGAVISSDCLSSCTSMLGVFLFESNVTDATAAAASVNITQPVASLNFTTFSSNTFTVTLPSNSTLGFHIVIQDQGSCVRITRISITYFVCPAQIFNFISYPQSLNGQSVRGECVDNAESDNVVSTCPNSGGNLTTDSAACLCSAGFADGPDTMSCSECGPDMFSNSAGSSSCQLCPANSTSLAASNVRCDCKEFFARSNPSDVTSDCNTCVANYYLASSGCVACPSGSSRAGSDPADQCSCDANRTRSNPDDASLPCDQCVDNYFLSSGDCTACPTDSASTNGASTGCECVPGSATDTGSTTTMNGACSSCQGNYYRSNGGQCVMCPGRSSRVFSAQPDTMCVCDAGRTTVDGDINTNGKNCSECALTHYPTSGGCSMCPAQSERLNTADSECTCLGNTAVADGGTTTINEPCTAECAANTFLLGGVCVNCPGNSVRQFGEPANLCSCEEGYSRRVPPDPTADCLPTLGFAEQAVTLMEGAADPVVTLTVTAPPSGPFTVMLSIDSSSAGYLESTTFEFSVDNRDVPLNLPENELALEQPFTISLVDDTDNEFILDPATDSVTVTIMDNDDVFVGFVGAVGERYNESDLVTLMVGISTNNIAVNVTVEVTSDDQSGRLPESMSVVFEGNGSQTLPVQFVIDDDDVGQGMQDITFSLQVVSPPSGVTIGGSGFAMQTSITVEDSDPIPDTAFPIGAIIGIAVGGACLILILILVVVLCVCCSRLKVNRRGFYETYEDKATEPPTMLRYSASLRSISSQTVVPIDGRAAPKENEFYV